MLQMLVDRLQKLLAVKSIVTLALTGVFCVLCLNDMIGADQFMAIFTMVIGFYFGTQAERKRTEAATGLATEIAQIKTEEAEEVPAETV